MPAQKGKLTLVAWLNARGGSAKLSEIEAQFKKPMRGVVGKLAEKGWVK